MNGSQATQSVTSQSQRILLCSASLAGCKQNVQMQASSESKRQQSHCYVPLLVWCLHSLCIKRLKQIKNTNTYTQTQATADDKENNRFSNCLQYKSSVIHSLHSCPPNPTSIPPQQVHTHKKNPH